MRNPRRQTDWLKTAVTTLVILAWAAAGGHGGQIATVAPPQQCVTISVR